jgi:3-oxoacyl-[acyl-carrier protein] reductase
MRLQGKRALVTGSSRSIGRAIARLLAKEGVKVVINSRGSDSAGLQAVDEVVEEIRASGGTAIGLPGTVDHSDSAKKLIDGCVEAFGGIDILINNAGIYGIESVAPVTECSEDAWQQTISVNLTGVFYTCRAALPHMVRQRWGRIINAGSVAGTGRFGGSAYSASKAALFGLGRSMAADYGPYGITINTYNPEAHPVEDTSYYPAVVQRWVERGYVGPAEAAFRAGMGGPEGVAPWIAYLCTEEAAYLNGQVFAVDARRVALLGDPDENRVLFRPVASAAAWSIDSLSSAAPMAFPVRNYWPRRTGADLARWESPLSQFVPGRN